MNSLLFLLLSFIIFIFVLYFKVYEYIFFIILYSILTWIYYINGDFNIYLVIILFIIYIASILFISIFHQLKLFARPNRIQFSQDLDLKDIKTSNFQRYINLSNLYIDRNMKAKAFQAGPIFRQKPEFERTSHNFEEIKIIKQYNQVIHWIKNNFQDIYFLKDFEVYYLIMHFLFSSNIFHAHFFQ